MWYCPKFYLGFCPPLQDQDQLYGLGIRIGIYLIWLSSILAYTLLHNPISRYSLRDLNYCFGFAFFLTLTLDSQTKSQDKHYQADALIVILLLAATATLLTVLEVLERTRPKAKRREEGRSRIGDFLRLCLLAGFIIYLNYWWFRGVYDIKSQCARSTHFFSYRVRILGRFRLIGQIWSPLLIVLFIPVLIVALRWGNKKRRHAALNRQRAQESEGGSYPGPLNKGYWAPPPPVPPPASAVSPASSLSSGVGPRKDKRALFAAWIFGFGALFFILFLELMLAYSGNPGHINRVNDNAQLIPLLIGSGAMALVLWRLYGQRTKICGEEIYKDHQRAFLYDISVSYSFNRSVMRSAGDKFLKTRSRGSGEA
ncbi:hypothetical protein L873DRAFT_1662169 [Choiromyces venosus 120613-1]|uniref:Uncharacterized protein n=1 Tax=Choiromyces venosus 120613-1 TaxID=1336337 RepID=A0A3N4K551_9PEZI|nr:hypothetical protein L873DRAFT_1662169 [Choiromyces venosus 120613-1]